MTVLSHTTQNHNLSVCLSTTNKVELRKKQNAYERKVGEGKMQRRQRLGHTRRDKEKS